MGFRQTSLALRGLSWEEMLAACFLRPTGAREDFQESPIAATRLPSGWLLLVMDLEVEGKVIADGSLAALSASGEVIQCTVNETCMISEAAGWRHGRQEWRILHDCEKGLTHVHAEGNLPSVFAEIRTRLVEEQEAEGGDKADVDHVFDVPVEVAKSLTGYRYDEVAKSLTGYDQDTPALPDNSFEVLESTRPPDEAKSFIQRLL
jgi:hypothetical protein